MTRKVAVFRTAHFNAAHRSRTNQYTKLIIVPQWTDEQNKAFFGLCNNANYHGHNYELEVKVVGAVDEVSGYVIDMKVLKTLNPSAENIVWVIWEKLRKRIDNQFELSVRLYETPRNFVEFNGK